MSASIANAGSNVASPARYRSLQTLLLLMVAGSLIGSLWLLPSRLERIMAATERGDQAVIDRELEHATQTAAEPGETRTLVDIALTLGDPELAGAILERALSKQPNNLGALRLLLEVERQRHRMSRVAALDERIFALTGEPDSLREAADIYASEGMAAQRLDALRRLDAIGRSTASDIAELAYRLNKTGAEAEALSLAMKWLARAPSLPSEVVSLAAGLSSTRPDAAKTAEQLGTLISRAGEDGPFHVLIQTYGERGRPDLSLVAGRALGPAMQDRPGVALPLAQLEALAGDFAAARRRLAALERAGKLLPAELPLLIDLDIQMGDVDPAASLLAKLPAEAMTEGLPQRLAEAAFARNRLDLLAGLPVAPVAAVSPGAAAVVALAQGDKARATALATTALSSGGDLDGLGASFGWALRTLGLQHTGIVRLLAAARTGALTDDELSLLLDLASSAPADGPAVLAALRNQRDASARAGAAWAVAAVRQSRDTEVAAWLRSNAERMPTSALIDLLLLANQHAENGLAHVAGDALAGRTDLPVGWTPAGVAFAVGTADPLTPARIQAGLALIGSAYSTDAARNRVVASLTSRRDASEALQSYKPSSNVEPALDWLSRDVDGSEPSDSLVARFSLLASIAPQRAADRLSRVCAAGCPQLLPVYAAALLRSGKSDQARTALEAALPLLPPDRRDAVLYEVMSRVPKPAQLTVLRIGARSGRADWIAAYEDALIKSGNLAEARTELRNQAALPGVDRAKRDAIAARLVELNDRPGAIAVLVAGAAGSFPDDPAVQQLLYLWGPRADADAIAWVRDRADAAPRAQLPKWLENLAYVGAPGAVVDRVERDPAVLASASATRTYAAALQASHRTSKLDLLNVAQAATTADAATALAQLALDSSQQAAAWRAATKAVALATSDPAALLLAAQAAAALHRSDEAADLYARLLARGPQKPEIMVDAGDALISAKRPTAADTILAAALARMPPQPATLPEARLKARALLLLRRRSEATALLQTWLARFPDHAGLQADLLQAQTATR